MTISRNAAWLSALFVTALLLLAVSMSPPAGRAEEQTRELLDPIVNFLGDLARPTSDLILHAGEIGNLSSENALLRLEVATLMSELTTLREQQRTATAIVSLLDSAQGNGTDPIVASVLVRDSAPGRSEILIDKGATNGIRQGQAVLGPGGTLIGLITDVYESYAWIQLLTADTSAVAVVTQSSRTQGALVGTGTALRLELVERGRDIAIGDVLITSTLGGRLPSGLLAGRVTSVESEPQDLLQVISVEPLSDYPRIEHVLILTNFHLHDQALDKTR